MSRGANIRLKSPEEITILRDAGKILSEIVKILESSLKVGMSTAAVDALAENMILARGVKPAFKGYRGYPSTLCISVNEEVVHGIPGTRVINNGDIVSLDIGLIYKGYYSDMAVTVGVGPTAPQQQKLLDVTRQALVRGIAEARPGKRLGDISSAIERYVRLKGFAIVKDFVGHGIGRALHEDPEIPNYGQPNTGPILKEGMVLAIEPMVNLGTERVKVLSDGWTAVTDDGAPSAHFEHSIAITSKGPLILTE